MEKNPLGLTEQEYAAKREKVFRNLSPRQKASFMLMESICDLEQNPTRYSHEFKWDRGVKTQVILEGVLNGGTRLLPTPDFYTHNLDERYVVFYWNVKDSDTNLMDTQQMRLWFAGDEMHIRGNVALKLGNYKDEVEKIVGNIPYATMVFTDSFKYENKAMIDKRK